MTPSAAGSLLITRVSRRLALYAWVWITILAALLILGALLWVSERQRQFIDAYVSELALLHQARLDLTKGYLYVVSAGPPPSPFDRTVGLALLDQAVTTMEQVVRLARASTGSLAESAGLTDFAAAVADFRGLLISQPSPAAETARLDVELRTAFYDLERQAAAADAELERVISRSARDYGRLYAGLTSGAGVLLLVIGLAAYVGSRAQRRAEAARRESEERYRLLFENSGDAILFTEPAGAVYSANQAACRMFDRSEAEIVALGRTGIVDPHDPRLPAALALRRQTGRFQGELNMLRRDGTLFPAEISTVLFADSRGQERTSLIIRDITERRQAEQAVSALNEHLRHLIDAIKDLASARTLPAIQRQVALAARNLTSADGATIVFRDGADCYYADEEAMAPLWKGRRFPMTSCIGGWVMLNRAPAVIADVYADDRIPVEAYRPTFVKSMVMVPVNTAAPLAAIGNYWGRPHQPSAMEIELLQTLADAAARAIENVRLLEDLEQRVAERTARLEAANRELEAFAYSVSHDLRAPLRAMAGFSTALLSRYADQLDEQGQHYLDRIQQAAQRMGQLISDLLNLSRITRGELTRQSVDLGSLARAIAVELTERQPPRPATFLIAEPLPVQGDARLLRIALQNLLENAWKFSGSCPEAVIEVGRLPLAELPAPAPGAVSLQPPELTDPRTPVYYVRDNGVGFDVAYADKLFAPFHRLHAVQEFPGTGIGLAIVQRVIARHGGRIWPQAQVGQGATFYFTLGEAP